MCMQFRQRRAIAPAEAVVDLKGPQGGILPLVRLIDFGRN